MFTTFCNLPNLSRISWILKVSITWMKCRVNICVNEPSVQLAARHSASIMNFLSMEDDLSSKLFNNFVPAAQIFESISPNGCALAPHQRRRGEKKTIERYHRVAIACRYGGEWKVQKLNWITSELWEARSRLYRRRVLQVYTRWKALDEIYIFHILLVTSILFYFS